MPKKTITAWAGIIDGEIHWGVELYTNNKVPCIYKDKKTVKEIYKDVRKVEIRIIPNK